MSKAGNRRGSQRRSNGNDAGWQVPEVRRSLCFVAVQIGSYPRPGTSVVHNNGATDTTPDDKGLKYVVFFASLLFKSVHVEGREQAWFTTTEQR